ncbi:MAG TPA: CocE/NonD family hydrolase [Terriglobales bacterium]
MRRYSCARLCIALLFLVTLTAFAQNNDRGSELAKFIRANYTKYEFQIPMRDGVRLFTSVYVPKDNSRTYPVMLDRTPYTVSPYGSDNYKTALGPSEAFARSLYIFVYQDVRGRMMSEGNFVDMRPHIPNKNGPKDVDEASDTYDTIDWLIKNIPNNNGKVGMWGISYPGFYTAAGMIDAHPALKAVSPQAPIGDWFIGDDFHHNGALFVLPMLGFMGAFGIAHPEPTQKFGPRPDFGTEDGYDAYLRTAEPLSKINDNYFHHKIAWWDEIIQHPNYDAFWKARSLPQHLKNIKPAVLTVGGWFDAEDLWGALHTYDSANKLSPQGDVKLVMGPWCHGCWARAEGDHLGNVSFGSHTSEYYREHIEFPFFEHYLKGQPDPNLAEATVFETGTNQWRTYDSWPPKNTKKVSLYIGSGGKLSFQPPAAGAAYDEYVSDPAKPVPFLDYISIDMDQPYMTGDQREPGRRTDVLVYQTEPLDRDITLAGPIDPTLFVSTSGTDSDFVVKLIDVYPNDFRDPDPNPKDIHMGGYQQLVRGDIFRGRFRNSYEKPEPFEPNKVTKVAFNIPDVNHTFRRGHRIMVQVQSSWFPLADLNPQKFVPNIYLAKPEDFQKATQRVYHSPDAQSHIEVLELEH